VIADETKTVVDMKKKLHFILSLVFPFSLFLIWHLVFISPTVDRQKIEVGRDCDDSGIYAGKLADITVDEFIEIWEETKQYPPSSSALGQIYARICNNRPIGRINAAYIVKNRTQYYILEKGLMGKTETEVRSLFEVPKTFSPGIAGLVGVVFLLVIFFVAGTFLPGREDQEARKQWKDLQYYVAYMSFVSFGLVFGLKWFLVNNDKLSEIVGIGISSILPLVIPPVIGLFLTNNEIRNSFRLIFHDVWE
jgi:hypothetical protein